MIRPRYTFVLTVLILISCQVATQEQQSPAFWNDVQQLISEDVQHPKARNEILFVGSSSFTYWKTSHEAFPEKTIVNVGFGGSTLLDQIRYVDYVITPYQPRQVVIYCGENDIAYDSTVTGREVLNRFIKLEKLILERFPGVYIAYVSMKPSPSREKLMPVYREGNELIREYLKSRTGCSYINVFDAMLDSSGKPRLELFIDDKLHMNEAGYAIWKELIRPHLQ